MNTSNNKSNMDYKILLLSLLAPNSFGLYIKPYQFIPHSPDIFNENNSILM